jgi:hypothetical protein
VRENQKGSPGDLLIREVSVRGTVLRSTSYAEKEERELNMEDSRVLFFQSQASARRRYAREVSSRKDLHHMRRLLWGQSNDAACMAFVPARHSTLRSEPETGQFLIAPGTTTRSRELRRRNKHRSGTMLSGKPEPLAQLRDRSPRRRCISCNCGAYVGRSEGRPIPRQWRPRSFRESPTEVVFGKANCTYRSKPQRSAANGSSRCKWPISVAVSRSSFNQANIRRPFRSSIRRARYSLRGSPAVSMSMSPIAKPHISETRPHDASSDAQPMSTRESSGCWYNGLKRTPRLAPG